MQIKQLISHYASTNNPKRRKLLEYGLVSQESGEGEYYIANQLIRLWLIE